MRSIIVKVASVLGLLLLATLFSCTIADPPSTTSGSGTPGAPIPDYPIPDPNVTIWADASPLTSVPSGSTPYTVFVQFDDKRTGAPANAFSDAVVTVNGLTLDRSTTTDNYFARYTGLTLGTGDTVTVKIVHPVIGTVTASTTVPASVPDIVPGTPGNFTFDLTTPLPPPKTANTSCNYTINWTSNGSPEYEAWVWVYDTSLKPVRGYGFTRTGSSCTFLSSLLVDSSTTKPYEWLRFSLAAVNKAALSGFGPFSGLRVEGTYLPPQSNM